MTFVIVTIEPDKTIQVSKLDKEHNIIEFYNSVNTSIQGLMNILSEWEAQGCVALPSIDKRETIPAEGVVVS